MVQAILVTLIITMLTVVSPEDDLLPPGPIYKEVGKSVLFTVIPPSHSIEAIRWQFNGSEIIVYKPPEPITVKPTYQGRVVFNQSTGELELKGLTMADTGEYSLTLTYEHGLGSIDHIFMQVFEPVFSLGIIGPEGNLIEYSDANFTCAGNGSISTTLWIKEGVILDPSSNIVFLDDNKTMVISPVLRSDNGYYQCALSNPVSSTSASYRITVSYGPDVRILGAPTLDEGSDILLLCSPDSVPPATVTWTVKGMPAGNTPLYVTENSKPSNSGDYNCTCRNDVTGITAFAIQVVTVRAVSSRLGPGVEVGIMLGVIALVALPLLIYFLVKHFKKTTDTGKKAPAPVINNSQINQTFDHNYEEAEIPCSSSAVRRITQESQPFPSRPPATPPNSKRPLPPNRDPRGQPPLPSNREIYDSELYYNSVN